MENPETETVEAAEAVETVETTEIVESAKAVENAETVESAEETSDNDTPAEKKTVYPTQMILAIRTIVGAYVLYLAYQIMTSENEITPLMWAAVAVFIVAGTGIVVTSIKHFICGEYEGGKKDV